jgi:hypothetical protein
LPLLARAQGSLDIQVQKQPCDPQTGQRGPLPERKCYFRPNSQTIRETSGSQYADTVVSVDRTGNVTVCEDAIPINEKCEPARAAKKSYCDFTGCHALPNTPESTSQFASQLDKFKDQQVQTNYQINAITADLSQQAEQVFGSAESISDPSCFLVSCTQAELQGQTTGALDPARRVVVLPQDQLDALAGDMPGRLRQYAEQQLATGNPWPSLPFSVTNLPFRLMPDDLSYQARDVDTGVVTNYLTPQGAGHTPKSDPEPLGTPRVPPYNYNDPYLANPMTPPSPSIPDIGAPPPLVSASTFSSQSIAPESGFRVPADKSRPPFVRQLVDWEQGFIAYVSNLRHAFLQALHI